MSKRFRLEDHLELKVYGERWKLQALSVKVHESRCKQNELRFNVNGEK